MALPAALLVQLQLPQHAAGLVCRVYQQSQYLDERQSRAAQKVIFKAEGCGINFPVRAGGSEPPLTHKAVFTYCKDILISTPEQIFKAEAKKKNSSQLIISVCVVDFVCSICITGFK